MPRGRLTSGQLVPMSHVGKASVLDSQGLPLKWLLGSALKLKDKLG